MKSVVIAGYARSPFTLAKKGELARVRPDDLAAQTVRALVERTGVDPNEIEDLLVGCAFPEGEQGFNVARIIGFLAELPLAVGGATMNRFCGSSMQAIHMAAGAIQMNAGELFLCAGVESMTRVPMGGFNPLPNPALFKRYPQAFAGMGETAENLAKQYKISRQRQEEFALASQQKTAAAQAAGKFDAEIVPIDAGKGGTVSRDGTPRPDTTLEGLANLKLAFDDKGTVTAGTSSPVTDGASATVVCSEEYAQRKGWKPLARIKSIAISGCAPEIMGIGPVLSTRKAARARRLEARRHRHRRAQRGVRGAVARLHRRARPRSRRRSTSTAERSHSGTLWVLLARASPARRRRCSSAKASATRSPRSASAAARVSPPFSRRSEVER